MVFLTACILFGSAPALAQVKAPEQLNLEGAVSFAFQNSPVLKGSQAEVAAARARRRGAIARTLPQLSLNVFATKANMTNVLQSGMGVEPQALVLAPERNYSGTNLTLMAPLYTGGRLSGFVSSAAANEKAMVAENEDMRAEVALEVREAYTSALYGVELVKAQQARVDAAQAMVQNAEAQVVAGKAIEATVLRAQAELADAKQEATMAENDRKKMLLDLLAAMGADLDSLPTLTEALVYQPVTGTLKDYLDTADERRGAVLAAKERVKAALGQLTSAVGATRPQLYGFAMGDSFAPGDAMGKTSGYTAGISLSLPLFDAGMRRSDIAEARAMVDRSRSNETVIELQTSKEVRQAWLDIETADQNYNTAQAALSAAQAAYEVTVLRVQNGKSIFLEQLDSLAALTKARANLAGATYNHQIAIAKLYRAAGLSVGSKSGDIRP